MRIYFINNKKKNVFDKIFTDDNLDDDGKVASLCNFYNCKNVDEINDFIASILIDFIIDNEGLDYILFPISERTHKCKREILNGKLPISKVVYDYFIYDLHIKIDYFYDNQWNEFKIDCYEKFKELYKNMDELTIYIISYNVIYDINNNHN